MTSIRFMFGLGAALTVTACGALFGAPSDPRPLPVPAPPTWPEPTLVVRGPVFAYAVDGKAIESLAGADDVFHEMALGKNIVRLRAPHGWTASYAGVLWMQNDEDSQTRFVIYPVADHESTFRSEWRARDTGDPVVTVSEIHSFESPRKPILYTYCRKDDGRCGIVYALLTDPNRADSGVIVHGVWRAENDRRWRPVVVAAANGITLARTK